MVFCVFAISNVWAKSPLTPEVMWQMGRVGEFVVSPAGVVYGLTNYDVEANSGTTDLWLNDLKSGQPVRVAENAGSPAWHGGKLYFLRDGQIWCDGQKLTDIEGGVEYFGIAPKGDKIFYVQRVMVDAKGSAEQYDGLEKSKALIYDDLMVRHWNRWSDGTHLHIFVGDFDGTDIANVKDIMEGEPWDTPMEPYFDAAEIAWNNAGTILAYTCKKLTGRQYAVSTDSDIYLYDVRSGETDNLTRGMVGYDKYPVWSPDDKMLAFRSMARAGNEADKERLMVWDFSAEKFSDLTADFDYPASNVVWDGNKELLFLAPHLGTVKLCRADLKGRVKIVAEGDFDITAFSASGKNIVASLTRQDQAAELYIYDGQFKQLTHVNDRIFDELAMGKIERRMVRTSDGKEMLTWVTYPPDFDPTKKYPALLYCEGGPQSVMSQGWSYRWNYQLMAAQGYIVVAPCRRGTIGFGQAWTDQISGDYSGQNIADYLAAIDQVAAEPYVDETRLGCVGASYGGYSVFYLAGVHQGRFKAFISHCGIFDFESMYGETEELFFVNNDYGGAYWDTENEVAMRSYAHSPNRLVKNWDTPILIITGARDYRIPYTQSIEAHTAARLLGVDSRLVVFEDEAHQVFKPQNNLVWNAEFFGWLERYL